MATLEKILIQAPILIQNLNKSITYINTQIDDLLETKNEFFNRLITINRDSMVQWVSDKTEELINDDLDAIEPPPILSEYQYILGNTFWSGELSGNVIGVNVNNFINLNINDWEIQKRIRASELDDWEEWILEYDYSNVILDDITAVIDLNLNFNYGWDYITQNPINQDGTYGIVANIQTLTLGKNILTEDKVKHEDSLTYLPKIL